jgi:type II secretory pathway pseudopilin PulG
VELVATLLALVIFATLAIELAASVRRRSGEQATAAQIARVQAAAAAYRQQHGTWPNVLLMLSATERDAASPVLAARAELAAEQLADALKIDPPRDVWGSPIVLVTLPHRALGLSPGGDPFLMSAGPDGNYLTRGDNVYSYEAATVSRR